MNTCIKSLLATIFLLVAATAVNAQQTAYIQIAHNSADTTLDTIDLYFNRGDITYRGYAFEDSNVVFHSATGLIQYPIDSPFTIGINYRHSNGNPSNDSIYSVTYPGGTLTPDERKAFIISGVYGLGYAPNPNATLNTGISIQEVELDTVAPDTAYVSLRFFHGVTDLDTIQIKYRNGGQLFPGTFVYGNSTPLNDSIHHNFYEFQVTSPDTSKNYGTFSADLSTLGGNSILILGSGFLNPAVNDSGPAFGLYGLLNTGSVVTFPLEATGFQLLNNCADPSADSLDIYINGILAFPSLGFRNATAGLIFNAYAKYDVGIAPKHSASVNDTFWHETFFFPRDTFFIATALGLLSQTGFAPNPDGINTAFKVDIKSPAEFVASSQSDFDFYMINGITDAPQLNLVPQGGPYLLTDVAYSEQTNYVSLPSEFYDLYVQDTTGNLLVSGFANFLAFNAQSAVLLTSGFLNPAANNNGAAMGLYMVPTTGGPFTPLFSVTGINKVEPNAQLQVFPNPASNQLHVLFTTRQAQTVSLQITDINGNLVKQILNDATVTGAQNIVIDLSGLSEGVYFSRLVTSEGINNYKFAIAY